MGYRNGKSVLPPALLKRVQQYVSGECLYIPQCEKRPRTIHPAIAQRDAEICRRRAEGCPVRQLAEDYFLSTQAIYKILAKRRR